MAIVIVLPLCVTSIPDPAVNVNKPPLVIAWLPALSVVNCQLAKLSADVLITPVPLS